MEDLTVRIGLRMNCEEKSVDAFRRLASSLYAVLVLSVHLRNAASCSSRAKADGLFGEQ